MQPSSQPAKLHVLLAVCSALVSGVIAAVAVRTPAAWPLLPRALMELALKLVGATSQEQVANAEFIGAWLFAFLVTLVSGYLFWGLLQRRGHK